MKKKVLAILLFIIVCAVAAVAIGFLRPYKPTSFVVDGDIFSATVEDGATLILDLDNDSNRKEWSIIQTPERSQCFIKDFVTVTENVTEFHIIATDDGKGVMTFQSVSDDGTTEDYELELTISRHKKNCLQIDTVSFVKTESNNKNENGHEPTETINTPEERNWDRIPAVMVDGVLYESTGYISSAIGCGNMDDLMSLASGRFQKSKNSPLSTPRSFLGKKLPMPNTAKSATKPRNWPLPREISRPSMKQSDKMSRIDSQSKKPINKTVRRTALTFRVVLLPFFIVQVSHTRLWPGP